jgi:hypothetical protein
MQLPYIVQYCGGPHRCESRRPRNCIKIWILISTPGLATRSDWPLRRARPQGPPPKNFNFYSPSYCSTPYILNSYCSKWEKKSMEVAKRSNQRPILRLIRFSKPLRPIRPLIASSHCGKQPLCSSILIFQSPIISTSKKAFSICLIFDYMISKLSIATPLIAIHRANVKGFVDYPI